MRRIEGILGSVTYEVSAAERRDQQSLENAVWEILNYFMNMQKDQPRPLGSCSVCGGSLAVKNHLGCCNP